MGVVRATDDGFILYYLLRLQAAVSALGYVDKFVVVEVADVGEVEAMVAGTLFTQPFFISIFFHVHLQNRDMIVGVHSVSEEESFRGTTWDL